jgi:hypothetical protein
MQSERDEARAEAERVKECCQHGDKMLQKLKQERHETGANLERIRRELDIVKRELNEAGVEVERLKSQSAAREETICEEINARVCACINDFWLERDKMIAERDAGRSRLKEVFDANERLIAQRDEARAEVARLGNELQQMQCAGFDEQFRPTNVRPEPSRLEIAAMMAEQYYAGNIGIVDEYCQLYCLGREHRKAALVKAEQREEAQG